MSGRKLGRGLDTLIGNPSAARMPEPDDTPVPSRPAAEPEPGPAAAAEGPEEADWGRVLELDPTSIEPNPEQPRRDFQREELEMLKTSISRDGVLQPILVRRVGSEYQLVAGERRLRACQELRRSRVPALLIEAQDERLLELALVENIQRQDLNPIETAQAYRNLLETKGLTQEELGRVLGMSRPKISNMLRLLDLPEEIQAAVVRGHITLGHAKILLSVQASEEQQLLFNRIAEDNLSVRDLEEERDNLERKRDAEGGSGAPPRGRRKNKSPQIANLEEQLSEHLGTRVVIEEGKGKGRLIIEFYAKDDFERLRDLLLS